MVAGGTKASRPLGWPMRILFLFIGASIVSMLIAAYYDSTGQKRKAKDCFLWFGFSLLFYLGLILFLRVYWGP